MLLVGEMTNFDEWLNEFSPFLCLRSEKQTSPNAVENALYTAKQKIVFEA